MRCDTQIVPRARVTLPRDTMLVPVTTSVWGMEYSVHACPKKHKAEAEAMFPGLDVSDLLVIPTCQVRFETNHSPNTRLFAMTSTAHAARRSLASLCARTRPR